MCEEKERGNVAPVLQGRDALQLWLQVADMNVMAGSGGPPDGFIRLSWLSDSGH